MVEIPYIDYDTDEMSLRDFLALDRTKLANERTLLSYFRTGFAFSAGGVTITKLFPEPIFQVLGWIFVPIGIIITFFGIYRFFETRHNYNQLDETSLTEKQDDRNETQTVMQLPD